jgi:cell division protein FtsL
MKKTFLLATAFMLCICTGVFAQTPKVNTDSLSLVSKISEDQLKLGKLQNEVDQKTRAKQDAAVKAQQSADANAVAANRLTSDPGDQKLARQADNKAGDAKSDARFSRKEARRLDDLNKEISDLKIKIAANQEKLNKYIQAAPAPAPAPAQ